MRFFLERSCQERKKGEVNWNDFSKKISEEWKGLTDSKKKYYEDATEIRNKRRNEILKLYNQIKNCKKSPASPYIRFFKIRYAAYRKQMKAAEPKEITRLIAEDWKKVSEKDKQKFVNEYEREKTDRALIKKDADLIDEYKLKCEEFN